MPFFNIYNNNCHSGPDPESRNYIRDWIPTFVGMTALLLALAALLMSPPLGARDVESSDESRPRSLQYTKQTLPRPEETPAELTYEEKCKIVNVLSNKTNLQAIISDYKNEKYSTVIKNNYYICFGKEAFSISNEKKLISINNIDVPVVYVGLNLVAASGFSSNSPLISISSSFAPITFENLQISGAKVGIEIGADVKSVSSLASKLEIFENISCSGDDSIGIQLLPEAENVTLTGFTIKDCQIGIKNEANGAFILGGKISASSGAYGIYSLANGVTIDQSLSIVGFKRGIKSEGNSSVIAGVNIECANLAESAGLSLLSNDSIIGPDVAIQKCSMGIYTEGQNNILTLNDLNQIVAGQRIVMSEGSNGDLQPPSIVVKESVEDSMVWKYYDKHDTNMIDRIVGLAEEGVKVEMFVISFENKFAKQSCDMIKKTRSIYPNIPIEDGVNLFECHVSINKDTDNSHSDVLAWFTSTINGIGTSRESGEIKLLDVADGPSAPGAVILQAGPSSGADLGMDTIGSDSVFEAGPGGEVDIVPSDGNGEDEKVNAMGAGDSTVWAEPGIGESGPIDGVGGLSILSSGGEAGAAKAGCMLDRNATQPSGVMWVMLLMGAGLISYRRLLS